MPQTPPEQAAEPSQRLPTSPLDPHPRNRSFLTGADEHEVRNKIAMVLFALEKAVGDRLLEESERHRATVPETFFQEIIEHAASARKGTDLGENYRELRELLSRYEVVEIRNAVSHPNRGVFDNYWFRVCALATEPCIERLGLIEVKEALVAASLGRIKAPPTHWFLARNFSVANTLPEQADFDITGFVGRQADKKNLHQLIENRRINSLAVVGPGGTGKTALVLSLLRSLAHEHQTENWCAAILFVSAKKQELTAEGIKPLQAKASLDTLLSELKSQAEQIGYEDYLCDAEAGIGNKKIIVCIDNFETVSDLDSKSIAQLQDSLPEHVKLVLTSRYPIDGVASCVLDNLQEADAINLGKRYAERCGITQLSGEAIVRIVKNVQGSPLAIKIAIDLYNRGYNEVLATGKARIGVVAFSFANLLDHLNEEELEVIEFLFLVGSPSSRSDAVSVLGYDEEIISSALINLSRTCLVKRIQTETGDYFDLSDNVRDLIMKNDRNLKVRDRIRARLRKRQNEIRVHESLQRDGKILIHSEDYIPPETPEALKHLLIHGVRLLRAKRVDEGGRWLHEADQLSGDHPNHPKLLSIKGRILCLLGDLASAEEALKRAVQLQPDTPWHVLALADVLLESIQEDRSAEALDLLMTWKGRDVREVSPSAYRRYWVLTYKCFKSADRWEDALNLAKGLLEMGDDELAQEIHLENAAYASFKAVRHLHYENPATVSDGLLSSASYFQRLVDKSGLMDHQVRMCITYFKELRHFFGEHDGVQVPKKPELLEAAGHLADTMLSMRLVSGVLFDQCVAVCGHLGLFDCPEGSSEPLIRWAPRKLALSDLPEAFVDSVYSDSRVLAKAKVARSTIEKGYLFGQCVRTLTTYFLHVSQSDVTRGQLQSLQKDTLILLEPDPESDPSKPAVKTWTILTDSAVTSANSSV
jgi:tetratricopeptide (TPR) repeat protein